MNKNDITELVEFVVDPITDLYNDDADCYKHRKTLNQLIESNKQMESDLKEIDKLCKICDEQYYEDDDANFYVGVDLLKTITSKYKDK